MHRALLSLRPLVAVVAAAWIGLALLAPLAGPAFAQPEPLKGTRFLDVMENNTLSGTTEDGTAYNLYFLSGGELTYEDASGARDRGRWSMGPGGDVCVRFEQVDDGRQHCFDVEVDGRKLTWRGKGGEGKGTLRGGVAESFLKPR